MYISVKEVSRRYGISKSSIYQMIQDDPTFPSINVGLKKKLVINQEKLRNWYLSRSTSKEIIRLPSNKVVFIRREK